MGANGISWQAMVAALQENRERWSQIYAMSREEPSTPATSTVKRILIDLLDGPEIIAESLQKNKVKA